MQKMGWFGVVRGHSRSTAMSPFDRAHATSYSTLIGSMCLSCIVFTARCYSSAVLAMALCLCLSVCSSQVGVLLKPTPPAFGAPHKGVTPVEFRGDLWHQKTRVPGLSCDVVCVILRLAVLVEHRLVTDTDRQTQAHG